MIALARFTPAAALKRAVVVLLLAFGLAGCGINSVPTAEERVNAAWGNLQADYQRRADLIPNLVATVKGYAQQEKTVLTEVTQARASATSVKLNADDLSDPAKMKQFQDAQNQLTGSLSRLMVSVEAYPDLKSNQNFLALQSQLEGTENRIAVARRDYIQAVQAYNTEVRTFPGRLWAMVYGAKPMETFTVAEDKMNVPPVKF